MKPASWEMSVLSPVVSSTQRSPGMILKVEEGGSFS